MNKRIGFFMTLFLGTFLASTGSAQITDREKVPEKETWRLADLYPSTDDWKQAKEKLVEQMDEVSTFKGKLADSPQQLLACLQFSSDIYRDLNRLYSYAHMMSDQDTRNSVNMALEQEASQIYSNFGTKAAFIEPEIVAMDKATIDDFIANEPGLDDYKFYLYDLMRKKEHLLSENEEKILAQAGRLANGPSSIYSVFTNAELPYPKLDLGEEEEVFLNQSGYARYRASKDRAVREKVFDAFFGKLYEFRRTLGAQLYANVQKEIFYSNSRGYESTLHRALDANNIPVEVYHKLVENVNKNLDTFHRYLSLKQRMLNLDTLKYSDLYAPVVEGVDLEFTIPQAEDMVMAAMTPLGKEYLSVLDVAFSERWIDYHPTIGKRSGAYSSGSAYDVHPYILMNFNAKYNDVSTLAHELGHSLHSYFSNKTQPFPKADYPIFVAEVASTLNEALLIDKQLNEINDDDIRLSLLMNYLDGIKGTVFRQTQFAEFELKIHETAQKDQPLTGDNLSEMYGDILKRYYGHEKGICHIDDLFAIEWAYIPHFYYNFYVYQYATSFTASTALSEKILAGDKGIVDKYLTFISSGGSDYPIELLKKAGADLTTDDPFNKTMQAMNRTMDEIEKILDAKGI
jgi:oligoendopeptidase F